MDALTFLKAKFPMWEIQDRGPFNTVSLREENLIEAMEEYAELKSEEPNQVECSKERIEFIEEFPFNMFSPIGKKSEAGKTLLHFEAEKRFPSGWKVTDFDKDQKLVEVEDEKGERDWLVLQFLFRTINLATGTRVKQHDGSLIKVVFHSVGSMPGSLGKGDRLFLIFEVAGLCTT